MISVDTIESFDEKKAEELLAEKNKLQADLDRLAEQHQKDKNNQSRIAEIIDLIDGLKNRTLVYDDKLVRQIIEAIIVESKEKNKSNLHRRVRNGAGNVTVNVVINCAI